MLVFAVAGDVPGEADAGLWEEAGTVVGEGGGAYGGGGVDDAGLASAEGSEAVDAGVAVGRRLKPLVDSKRMPPVSSRRGVAFQVSER